MEITNNYFSLNPVIKVKESLLLPYDETVRVYDIKTHEGISVLTGRKINCIKINDNELIVSKELYNQISKI
jgi:hypothetical protein